MNGLPCVLICNEVGAIGPRGLSGTWLQLQMVVDSDCTGCENCITVCPVGAIAMKCSDDKADIMHSACQPGGPGTPFACHPNQPVSDFYADAAPVDNG